MFIIFSVIIILALLFYVAISAAIVFHLKKYGVEGDNTKKMRWIFIGISIILVLGLLFIFLGAPWEQII